MIEETASPAHPNAWRQWRQFLRETPGAAPLDDPEAEDCATPRRPARLGWWLLAIGLGGFLLWAGFAQLDNGVPMPGLVMVAGNRQAVEHAGGGIVGALDVREGDRVRAGQVLLRIDPTRIGAEARSLSTQLAGAQARIARLTAERDGLAMPGFAPELARSTDPETIAALSLQRQLFASRRAALQAELIGIEQALAGQSALVGGIEASLGDKRAQLRAMNEQLGNLRQLANEGYIPRNRLLESERLRASIQSDISRDLGSIGQARGQAAEMRMRILQRRDEWQQQVRSELAEATHEAQGLAARETAARFELAHAEVRAPAAGRVVGLAAHTVGGVIQPGARLMEIVPDAAPLIVEGRLPVASVDKVQPGLPVDLLFSAFDRARTPRLRGRVEQVSADRLEDERSGQPYYRVRILVGDDELARLKTGDQPLRPGMPVEVFVRTGERTLLNYLFKPLLDRLRTAWGDQ